MASNKKKKSKPAKKTVKKAKPAKKVAEKIATKKAAVKKPAAKAASKKSAAKVVKPTPTATKKPSSKMSVSFHPLYDHLLILQDGESDRTPGGLYIPAIAQDRPARGKVLAVGNGRKNKKGQLRALDVKVGESVIYSHYSGSKITIEGTEYLILNESDVLGVMRD